MSDNYREGIIVNHTCNAAIILEKMRWYTPLCARLERDFPDTTKRIQYWSLDNEQCLHHGILISVAKGGSIVASLAERFRVSGARSLIRIATTGTLVPGIPIGSVILPIAAIRDEGTSYHYLRPEVPAVANTALLAKAKHLLGQRGIEHYEGLIWTTDGRWKETDEKLSAYRNLGAIAVDMETASLYSVGMDRSIPTIALNIVTDSPSDEHTDFRGRVSRELWEEVVMPRFFAVFNVCKSLLAASS